MKKKIRTLWSHKITPAHLALKAVVYLRQSSLRQVKENIESQRLQYALVKRAQDLGWNKVEVFDDDLGKRQVWGPENERTLSF